MAADSFGRTARRSRPARRAAIDEVVAGQRIADEEQADLARAYLRNNVQFALTEDGRAGVKRFFTAAADIGIVPRADALRFFDA